MAFKYALSALMSLSLAVVLSELGSGKLWARPHLTPGDLSHPKRRKITLCSDCYSL